VAEGTPNEEGDGSEWTVAEDWETVTGLVHDIFHVDVALEVEPLLHHFALEPMFLEVIKSLKEVDQGSEAKARRRAKHRAEGYMIEDGKLWRLGGGKRMRGHSRVECVTREEATALARVKHLNGGHWQHDSIKCRLTDTI
jgi:hypothetical protein